MDIEWKLLNNDIKTVLNIDTKYIIEASNNGQIKIDTKLITGGKGSKGKYGFYKIFKLNDKTLYFHRIIYLAFHPEDSIKIKEGARIIMKDNPSIVINEFYRNYPDDMLIDPWFTIKPQINDTYDINDIIHNDYGIIKSNTWMPLHYKNDNDEIIKTDNYLIKFYDDIEHPFDIINIQKDEVIRTFNAMITFSHNDIQKKMLTHVLLSSAFPKEVPNETVDHINDNPDDNRISNLRWLSQTDNSKKGQKKSAESKIKNGGAKGRKVIMCNSEMIELKDFINIRVAAEYLIDNDNRITGTVKTVETKIRRAIKDNIRAYDYYWTEPDEKQIEGEIWKDIPDFYNIEKYNGNTYQISSFGRVRSKHKLLLNPVQNRDNPKYTTVSLAIDKNNAKRYYIHRLVWETFNGQIPEGFEVLHNDHAPLLENGSYRNWLVDLSLGTRKQNMQDYYDAKHSKLKSTF